MDEYKTELLNFLENFNEYELLEAYIVMCSEYYITPQLHRIELKYWRKESFEKWDIDDDHERVRRLLNRMM